jgi:hypothetical protein
MRKQYIYTLTDPISNIIRYVGKSNNPHDRLRRHLSDTSLSESWTNKNKWLLNLKNNNLLPILNIIDESNDENIDSLEIKWISYYRNLGIVLSNMTDGGDGTDWTGKKHSVESIEKMKMNHPLRREVIQFDLDNQIINFFDSLHDSSEKTGLSRSSISRCCNNTKRYVTVSGYYFRFIDNYFTCIKSKIEPDLNYIISEIDKFKKDRKIYLTRNEIIKNKIKESSIKRRKKIIHYSLDGEVLSEYTSMTEARDITNCSISLISKCCNRKSYYTVNNSTFRYSTDIFDYIPYNKSIQVNSRRICKYDLDGNIVKIYDSIKQSMRDNSIISDENIISCCKKKTNKKNNFIKVKGFTYRYFEDTNGLSIN